MTIVGGGIAGTLCAYRLQQMGITAGLYQASPRLGGRIWSDRDTFTDGQHCELGAEYIDSIHTTLGKKTARFMTARGRMRRA